MSLMLAVLLLIMVPIQAMGAPGDYIDIPKNWSTQALNEAVENGLMQGYQGKLFPEKNLTRAEMAAMMNRALNSKTKASLSNYVDVVEGSWQYKEMSKAVGAKIFQGSGNKLNPNDMITREEAFVVLSRLMNAKSSFENKMAFYDLDQISTWARQGVNAMLNAGYVQGSDGYINPKAPITRAEFAQLMSNVVQTYIQTPGTHESVNTGNVVINVADVTLKDVIITGDLIIGDGVGDGDLTLDNVTIKGRLIARGGGENSIIIKGKSSIETIIIVKDGNRIRIFNDSGKEIATSTVEGNADVILEGKFKNVVIQSPNITVFAKDTKIEKVEINGEKSKVIADEKTTINKVEIKAEKVTIEGKGKVAEVEVKKEGSNASITTPNTEIKVDKEAKDIKGTGNITIKTNVIYVNGKTDKENAKPLEKPSTGGASSGGSSGGSSGNSGESPDENDPPVDKYTVTYEVIGENGTLTSEISSGSKVETGTSVTLNARPDATYEIKEWKVNEEVIYEEVEGDYGPVTFWDYDLENITEDTVVTVEFKRAPKQMLKYSVKGIGGTVTADYDNNSEIYYGTEVTFTAHPEDGYKVHKWIVDNYTWQNGGNELATSYNNYNFDVTVEFVEIAPVQKYEVTYEVVGGNGTLTGNVVSGSSVNEGTDITFTATPNAGYEVIEWKINDEVVAVGDEDSGYVVRDLEYTLTNIRENTTVTVRFKQIPPQYSLTYSVSGGVGGTIEALTARDELIESGTLMEEYSYVTIRATPNDGYRVKRIDYNGYVFDDGRDSISRSIEENTVITVEFEKIKHSVSFWIGGNPVHSELVSHGDKVMKMPKSPTQDGKIFLGWFDSTPEGVTTEITAETIVTKDIIASADWENVPNPMVTFDTEGGNNIDPVEVVWGELLTPPENPIRGYDEFHHWTIGGTNEPFDLEANPITEDIILYAKYINHYKIKFDVTPSNAVVTFDGETNDNNEFIRTNFWYVYTVELDGYVSRQRNEYWVYGDDTITVNLEKTSHYIVFEVDGETYISASIKHGEKLELPAEPTKQGKRFVGWFIEEGVTEVTEDTIVTERFTALAKWEDDTDPIVADVKVLNTNVLRIDFDKKAVIDNSFTKLTLLQNLFNDPSLDGSIVNEDNIELRSGDNYFEIKLLENAINKDLFYDLDHPNGHFSGNGDGIYRKEISINLAIFEGENGTPSKSTFEPFKMKFSVPFVDGEADYTQPIKGVWQTQAQRDGDIDPILDTTSPKLGSISPVSGTYYLLENESFIIEITGEDDNLKSTRLSNGTILFANEEDVFQDEAKKNEFEGTGSTVTYSDKTWTIDFGEEDTSNLISLQTELLLVLDIEDYAGNKWSDSTPEEDRTFRYTLQRFDMSELNQLKADAAALVEADYTEISWNDLQVALLMTEETVAEINNKVDAIRNSIDNLKTINTPIEGTKIGQGSYSSNDISFYVNNSKLLAVLDNQASTTVLTLDTNYEDLIGIEGLSDGVVIIYKSENKVKIAKVIASEGSAALDGEVQVISSDHTYDGADPYLNTIKYVVDSNGVMHFAYRDLNGSGFRRLNDIMYYNTSDKSIKKIADGNYRQERNGFSIDEHFTYIDRKKHDIVVDNSGNLAIVYFIEKQVRGQFESSTNYELKLTNPLNNITKTVESAYVDNIELTGGSIIILEYDKNGEHFTRKFNGQTLEEMLPDKNIMSVEALDDMEIIDGDALPTLPEKVTVTLSDLSQAELGVIWDTSNYEVGVGVGTHTITGTIVVEEGIENPNNIKAEQIIIVTALNNNDPVAVDDAAKVGINSTVGILIDVLENDTDEDNDTLTVESYTQGTNGTVTLIDNKLKYVPNPDFLGTDTFTYTISDERGGSDTATVTVTVLPKYTVTYSVVGFDYGTMQGNIASGSEVVEGGEVIFTAFPNDGYRVAGWQVDGSYQGEESNTFLLSPVTKDTIVSLRFEKILERYTLTYEVDGENGTINDTILSGSEFDAGEILTIKTSPADGYRVAKWNINGVDKPEDHYYSHTFTLEEDTHIIVSFELEPVKNTYGVTYGVEGDNPGNCKVVTNLSEDKLSAIEEGKNVIFSGSNYWPMYRIKAWRVNGVVNESTNSNLLIRITADTHVTAEFELAQ